MILSDDILHDRDPAVVSHSGGSPVIYDREKSHLFPSQILFAHAVALSQSPSRSCYFATVSYYAQESLLSPGREVIYRSIELFTLSRFSRKALDTTDRELNAIAAPATMGLNRIPKNG